MRGADHKIKCVIVVKRLCTACFPLLELARSCNDGSGSCAAALLCRQLAATRQALLRSIRELCDVAARMLAGCQTDSCSQRQGNSSPGHVIGKLSLCSAMKIWVLAGSKSPGCDCWCSKGGSLLPARETPRPTTHCSMGVFPDRPMHTCCALKRVVGSNSQILTEVLYRNRPCALGPTVHVSLVELYVQHDAHCQSQSPTYVHFGASVSDCMSTSGRLAFTGPWALVPAARRHGYC